MSLFMVWGGGGLENKSLSCKHYVVYINKRASKSYLLPDEANSDLHKSFEWQVISVRNSLSVFLVSSDAMEVFL